MFDIKNINKVVNSNGTHLSFEIEGDEESGLDKSLINSIRRIMIEDVSTIAFNYDEHSQDKDIVINTNTTSLHNEMIMHRLSMITLYLNPEEKSPYLFKLNAKHDYDEPYRFIDSNDIDIFRAKKDIVIQDKLDEQNYESEPITQNEKDKIFRPYVFRGKKYYSLLIELKNTHTGITQQELNIIASPSVGNGLKNANYQSCSKISYDFKIDDELVKSKLEEYLNVNNITDAKEIEIHSKRFIINEAERYYYRDMLREPYKYNFNIESQHYHDSSELFKLSLKLLINKLDYLKEQFMYMLKEEPSSISIEKTKEFVYTYTFNDENHTIGNLLQSHIVRRAVNDKSIINGCSYKKIHPLDETIILILSLNPGNKLHKKTEIQKVQQLTEFLRTQLDDIKKDVIDISKIASKKL